MNSIPAHDIEDLVILFRCGPESSTASRNIVEEILNSDLGALTSCCRLRVCTLTWLGWYKVSTVIVGFVSNVRILRFCSHSKMGNVANAGQRFSTKSISTNGRQVLEGLELGSCEPFA